MERVSEVIDCWYDSGAMPFAQWGYPHQNKDCFEQQFPADFISEAIDQTRGWFYSLLAVSTLVFSDDSEHGTLTFPHPYKNCVVLGLMLGEDGQKMSKSKRNYREPNEIFEKYGADALRWYFFSNQPPWTAIRYREQAIKESMPEFLLRLWNVLGFFVLYANIDRFAPESSVSDNQLKPNELSGTGRRDTSERGELDRWILSELNRTVDSVTVMLDAYDNYGATGRINQFVDALSNWYVRRSRQRFWAEDKSSQEKLDAHWTLYECLVTTAKMIAPFVPFLAETMWQTLSKPVGNAVNSVHLCDYPVVNNDEIDSELVDRMSLIRELASLGRSARAEARIKVRQPLESVTVIMNNHQLQSWTERDENILRSELNVRRVVFASDKEEFVNLRVVPNFQKLGPRLGKLMPKVKSNHSVLLRTILMQ